MNIVELKELIVFCKEQDVSELRYENIAVTFYKQLVQEAAKPPLTIEDVKKQEAEEYAKLMFMSSN